MCVHVLSPFSRVWLCVPKDYSLPGSSVYGIFPCISCIAGNFFTTEPQKKQKSYTYTHTHTDTHKQYKLSTCKGGSLLKHVSSLVAAWRHSCFMACGILVPRPGIEPMSPALDPW